MQSAKQHFATRLWGQKVGCRATRFGCGNNAVARAVYMLTPSELDRSPDMAVKQLTSGRQQAFWHLGKNALSQPKFPIVS